MISKLKFLKVRKIVFAPYLTLFGFLGYNSLRILKLYSIVSLTLKASPSIVGDRQHIDRPCRCLQSLGSGYVFLMNRKGAIRIKEFIER